MRGASAPAIHGRAGRRRAKLAGVRLPVIDYPIGPRSGFQGGDLAMPDIQIDAPGFDDADSLP